MRVILRKVLLVARIWWTFLDMRWRLLRAPLPEVAAGLTRRTGPPRRRLGPLRLSRAVHRSLRLGPWRPRCLFSALVLVRLLRDQGHDAVLVIGLPQDAADHNAHAWVELDGHDIGPPPGRGTHTELARYR